MKSQSLGRPPRRATLFMTSLESLSSDTLLLARCEGGTLTQAWVWRGHEAAVGVFGDLTRTFVVIRRGKDQPKVYRDRDYGNAWGGIGGLLSWLGWKTRVGERRPRATAAWRAKPIARLARAVRRRGHMWRWLNG